MLILIPSEADVIASLVTRIQEAIPKSTTDTEVVDLIGGTVPISSNPADLMAVAKTLFPHHKPEQDVTTAHFGIQVTHHDRNVNFKKLS